MKPQPFYLILLCIMIWLPFQGCAPQNTAQLSKTAVSSPSRPDTATLTPSNTPEMTHQPLPQDGGPYLLIEIDINQYQILDVTSGQAYPFSPPVQSPQLNIKTQISSSRQKLFFSTDQNTILITNLLTGTIDQTISSHAENLAFNLVSAVKEAQILYPQFEFTEEALSTMVKNAKEQSISHIRWHQGDRYLLIPLSASPTSTNLHLYDLTNNHYTKLENEPGFVHEYWVSPGVDKILLKKGWVFEANIWQDDQYYLVDIENNRVQPVNLPDNIDQPSVYWFSNDYLGIIHQMGIVGGVDFSLLDVDSRQTRTVVSGSFSDIVALGSNLVSVQYLNDPQSTQVILRNYKGEILETKTIDGRCTVKGKFDSSHLLFNCDSSSILAEGSTLTHTNFGEPIALFSQSPDQNVTVWMTRSNQVFLSQADITQNEPLELKGQLLEILWLPDSSGFLYRVPGQLFFFDLHNQSSQLLLSSTLFADYRNLNASWIDMDH